MHDCLGLLTGVVQPYAWGSTTRLAQLQRRPPTGEPEAELWFGAHPSAPSRLHRHDGDIGLDAHIVSAPQAELGADASAFGSQLPFLVKLIAAASPLSLQVHPSQDTARAGFAEEEARDVPRDAPQRRFRDPWPKPELIVALDTFDALCGFVPVDQAQSVLRALDVAVTDAAEALLTARGDDAWPQVVTTLLAADPTDVDACVEQIRSGAVSHREDAMAGWITDLATRYPQDPALLLLPLMAYRRLAPGEALGLEPGNVHAYLGGFAVEVMANSDNVMRGGLTNKHVDAVSFAAMVDGRLRPTAQSGLLRDDARHYACPTSLFDVAVYSGVVTTETPPQAQIWLCVDGSATLTSPSRHVELRAGEAAFACASSPPAHVSGDATLFRVTSGVAG